MIYCEMNFVYLILIWRTALLHLVIRIMMLLSTLKGLPYYAPNFEDILLLSRSSEHHAFLVSKITILTRVLKLRKLIGVGLLNKNNRS